MHFTESEIQKHIWSQRDRFASLLDATDLPDEVDFKDDLSDLTPQLLIRNRTISRLRGAFKKLSSMELIGMEVSLEQEANSTIRADFLAAFPGNTGIGIVELKKSAQTERSTQRGSGVFSARYSISGGLVRFHIGFEKIVDSRRMLTSPVSTVTGWSGLSRSA